MKKHHVAAVVILTIGLVVGANATIFTALNAILLRNLPVAQPDRLFRIAAVTPRGETREDVSYGDFVAMRDAYPSIAAFSGTRGTLGIEFVSDDFFRVIGAQLARGAPGVVISRDLEQRMFGGNALGPTPRRVMREIVFETLPLAIPAAIVAYVIATLGSRLYLARIPMQSRPPLDLAPDARVALFTLLLSVAAVFCAALVAAFYAR